MDLAEPGTQGIGALGPGIRQRRCRLPPPPMGGGRVTEASLQEGRHGSADLGPDGGGGSVVEVDRVHGSSRVEPDVAGRVPGLRGVLGASRPLRAYLWRTEAVGGRAGGTSAPESAPLRIPSTFPGGPLRPRRPPPPLPDGVPSCFRATVHGTVFGGRQELVDNLAGGVAVVLVADPPGQDPPQVWVHLPSGDPVGHLPPEICRWLAPWLQSGGRAAARVARVGGREDPSWRRVLLEVTCSVGPEEIRG